MRFNCNTVLLNISKAFDGVDHYALMNLLMDVLLSKIFISILLDWFRECFVCVRWGDAFSLRNAITKVPTDNHTH